ncbi:AAA family ATPase [Bradyrhizobium sp. 186]|uniref:AAA family ATPase n=1 Tax=Bradyrhizobium sp. 186 TaxID=2782654 RepID=UPI002001CD2A|nr:adenylate/guanylate cyclase domain-containing protein [Bradyrhizobium sp. 186]UPK38194.1 AAA family ATPase [Bradyrhizobium sp. 186]
MDLEKWLRGLGLQQYIVAFRDNGIDAEVLPELTDADLEKLGVVLGHRKRLLKGIAALVQAATIARTPSHVDGAERRQLTVMFCDLVGSTALSARLDPEDMREVIGTYQTCVAELVGQHEGFVAKYMGDGVLVYFGYPQALENDAERAVRAGLALVDAVGRLQTSERLRLRVGIATGLVVVGDLIGSGAAQERGVVGETPNLAARLQGLAEPNMVLISASTRRLTAGLFHYEDLGAVEAKGFAEPVRAWRVLGESAVESRFEALRSGEAPLIGREAEVDLLLQRWARAKAGQGQVVLLSGDPGIGKSRVSKAVQERIENEPHVRLRYFCSPYYRDSALYPHVAQLERAAGFEREDPPEAKLDKLEALLAPTASSNNDVALFAELLSLPSADRYPLLNFSPQRKREETFAALLRQLELLSRQQPILMVYEDVHWIDPTSSELLDAALERVERLPVLLLVTCRPEFTPSWAQYVTVISLSRLNRNDGAALVAQIAGNNPLPSDILAEIVERADGVPLFVEELTKAVLEAGGGEGDSRSFLARTHSSVIAVPATLHASLMARLDNVGTAAKEIAQIGAVIGREFSQKILSTAARLDAAELHRAINRLSEAGLVFRRGTSQDLVYTFKHALVQETAYGTLLRGKRRELHARIARALKEQLPEVANAQPERLAQHCTEAGLTAEAVQYWAAAGLRALARSANAEAIAQLSKGLELLASLPNGAEQHRQEVELQVALGEALIARHGYSAPATGRAYARARELSRVAGDDKRMLLIGYGQLAFHLIRSELGMARVNAEEMLALARRLNDPGSLAMGHHMVGMVGFFCGEVSTARPHLERAVALSHDAEECASVFLSPRFNRASALSWLSLVLFILGYPDQALVRSSEAVAEARGMQHLSTLAYILAAACRLLFTCRNPHLGDRVDELMALTAAQGFPFFHAMGTIYRGGVRADEGDGEGGTECVRQGLAALSATGANYTQPFFRSVLATALWKANRTQEALITLDEALERGKTTGDRWFEAELHRLQGDLLARCSDQCHAEISFSRALAVAHEQAAKMWELRAATSLAKLRRDQGKSSESRRLLAPVYGWFSEGFGTSDLIEAKMLLEELR